MPTSQKVEDARGKASVRRVAAGDKIVVEKLAGDAGDTISLDDVLLARGDGDLMSGRGLIVAGEIVAGAKGEKGTVFNKRDQNYRRKGGRRQQQTTLKIVAIGDRKAVRKALEERGEGADRLLASPEVSASDNTRELEALARELNTAAVRMEEHLDRAIEAVRASLDPEREAASRKRYEAEFAGRGDLLLAGLA